MPPAAKADPSHVGTVQRYYDAMSTFVRPERVDDSIFTVRRMNNWCKRVLIRRHGGSSLARKNVLDLGCGRGGDLLKLNGCASYAGIDISGKSVDEAMVRARTMEMRNASFHVADIFDEWSDKVEPESVDLVVCNLVLQNASGVAMLDRFTAQVSTVCKRQAAVAIITLPDYQTLSRLKARATSTTSAAVSSVETGGCVSLGFDVTTGEDARHLSSFERYAFKMSDAVAHDQEFAVPKDVIVDVFARNGWVLDRAGAFTEFVHGYFSSGSRDAATMADGPDRTACDDIAELYSYLVFKRAVLQVSSATIRP
tara:strand:+ start:1853 stop:2785 length:933 start_codon:yes stop_codon:yes gene_type:complete